jgi:hypothetical protein
VAKKAKYPAQKLTGEDREIIGQIFLRYVVKFYAFNSKYRGPKNFARRMVKEISSDTNIAALHTIAIAKDVSSDQVLRPREINQRFSQTIQKSIQQDLEHMMLNEGSSDLFLHPHDLTKVLKQLEKMGIFFNIKTKNQIRELERGKRHAGKKTHEDDRDLGGKPSVYKLTEEFEKLKNVIEKPEAAEMLYYEILRSRLAHKLIRFILLAFWQTSKMDKTCFGKSVGFGAAFFQDILQEEDRSNFKAIYTSLQDLNDNQLEQLADGYTDLIMHDRRYYKGLIIFFSFLKL